MNTILSIDLDIIFSPYVGIYNNLATCQLPPDTVWKNIQNSYYIDDFEPNKKYLDLILCVINNYQNKVNKIYIGEDHSCILSAMQQEKNIWNFPYKFNLYNIDYHHDIFYTPDQGKLIEEHGIADCGCWVGYLTYFDYINKYYWYCGLGADVEEDMLMDVNEKAVPETQRIVFNNFPQNLNIDLLFISLSWPWIPPNYYNIIKEVLNIVNYDKVQFLKYPFFYNRAKQDFLDNIGEQYYKDFDWLYHKT